MTFPLHLLIILNSRKPQEKLRNLFFLLSRSASNFKATFLPTNVLCNFGGRETVQRFIFSLFITHCGFCSIFPDQYNPTKNKEHGFFICFSLAAYTSSSLDPHNPATGLILFEAGKFTISCRAKCCLEQKGCMPEDLLQIWVYWELMKLTPMSISKAWEGSGHLLV